MLTKYAENKKVVVSSSKELTISVPVLVNETGAELRLLRKLGDETVLSYSTMIKSDRKQFDINCISEISGSVESFLVLLHELVDGQESLLQLSPCELVTFLDVLICDVLEAQDQFPCFFLIENFKAVKVKFDMSRS